MVADRAKVKSVKHGDRLHGDFWADAKEEGVTVGACGTLQAVDWVYGDFIVSTDIEDLGVVIRVNIPKSAGSFGRVQSLSARVKTYV